MRRPEVREVALGESRTKHGNLCAHQTNTCRWCLSKRSPCATNTAQAPHKQARCTSTWCVAKRLQCATNTVMSEGAGLDMGLKQAGDSSWLSEQAACKLGASSTQAGDKLKAS